MNTENTLTTNPTRREFLEVHLRYLEEKRHRFVLEYFFFKDKLYTTFEESENSHANCLDFFLSKLKEHGDFLNREVTTDDITKLLLCPVGKIARFNPATYEKMIRRMEQDLAVTRRQLEEVFPISES